MIIKKCDMCGDCEVPMVTVQIEIVSPHNGDKSWDKQDVCFDCIRKLSECNQLYSFKQD